MTSMMSIPRQIPLLVVDEEVLLPGSSMKIPVTNSRNMAMIKSRLLNQSSLTSTIIGVVPKEPEQGLDISGNAPLHTIGTAAVVVQVTGVSWPQPAFTLLVTGLCRFRVEKLVMEVPYLVGVVTQLDKLAVDDEDDENRELMDLIESFRVEASKLLGMLDVSNSTVARLKRMLGTLPAHHLADLCASLVNASFMEKLQVLDAVDMSERLNKALPLLVRQIQGLEMLRKSSNNHTEKHYTVPPKTKLMVIRPQQGTFSSNGNVIMPSDNELQELQNKLRAVKLPPHAHKVAMKELQRLKKLAPISPESGVIRTYLELMVELPWSKSSPETLDINKARQDLDADHYAMDKLKRRALEYLAVRQLKNSLRGPILCFVGPPGVGKTSVGRSIAQTLGREFHRISLGGSCNQSDIRGHRRTYIGAMPGRIIQGLKTVGVNNPVILLDEIDKLSRGVHGDPAAALLEVLDPEQNCNFVDHYLNVPFDLSQVMFIATANTTKTISPALLDRMELIHVQGYTQEEKLHIASRHLLPKQLEEHGLTSHMLQLPQESIKNLISCYTREAGVRTLERKLGALCRAVAVRVAEMNMVSTGELTSKNNGRTKLPIFLDEAALEDILGPAVYFSNELWSRLGQPGVAVGLAWTTVGGEVLLVEASKMEGDGELVLTGHLGDVMKESAKLALNWVRTSAREYGLQIDGELLSHTDLHIHFPAGAVGKDGPSAGVTIATALMSLFSERPVATDVAMTGEITLRGVVLPVGGVKEKILAAHCAGLKRIILPKKNEKDLHEVPDNIKKDLTFVLVNHVDEVLQAAFSGGFPTAASPQDVGSVMSKL